MATTQDRIIEATLGLITQHGLSSVTMVEIARTAGIARATLYNHYPDVATILADAATHHNNEAIAGLHQTLAVVSSPTDTIQQLVRFVAAIPGHGHTLQTHHGLPPELGQQLSAFDDELERQIQRTLTDGAGAGDFHPDRNTDTTAKLIRHMLNGVSELVAGSPDTAPSIVSEATKTILAALTNEQRP